MPYFKIDSSYSPEGVAYCRKNNLKILYKWNWNDKKIHYNFYKISLRQYSIIKFKINSINTNKRWNVPGIIINILNEAGLILKIPKTLSHES